jgi:hypothetical protein
MNPDAEWKKPMKKHYTQIGRRLAYACDPSNSGDRGLEAMVWSQLGKIVQETLSQKNHPIKGWQSGSSGIYDSAV